MSQRGSVNKIGEGYIDGSYMDGRFYEAFVFVSDVKEGKYLSLLFNEPGERSSKIPRKSVEPERPRTIADDFHDQIEDLYSIPQEYWPRKEVRFSPSMVAKCERELYYLNVDAEKDPPQPAVPWKNRLPRNGEGVHQVTQKDYLAMPDKMKKHGKTYNFKMLQTEVIGRKVFEVDGVMVVISGRCDGILLHRDGRRFIWEKKTKDKRKNLQKIKEPQDDHKQQVVAYSLIFDIPGTIFEYEALEKPPWMKDVSDDMKHFYVESTSEMEQKLLTRLAGIVKAIESKQVPPKDLYKCMFCSYKELCAKESN